MRLTILFLLALAFAGPLSAGLLESPDGLPGSTDMVLAIDISAGALPRNMAILSFASQKSEAVLNEQFAGFAADTGIDLTGPMSLVLAGSRAHPETTLFTGRLTVDTAKLKAVLLPLLPKLKMQIKDVEGGFLFVDKAGGILVRSGTFAVGRLSSLEALSAAEKPAASPESTAIAGDLSSRAGANATFGLLAKFPTGLPGNPPPAAAVGGQPLAGFWPRMRSVFVAMRERDFALELGFDTEDAAKAAEPMIGGWIKIMDGQLGAEEARAKAEAAASGPFKNLDPRWVGARLSSENFRDLTGQLVVKAEGPTLTIAMPRGSGGGAGTMMASTAIIGVLAAIAVPNFKAARERANFRACFANQKTIVGAMEMYNLDKNTRRETLDGKFFEDLKSGGYLQSIPQDPGQGEGSMTNYYAVKTGNGIACKTHGDIMQDIKGRLPMTGGPAAGGGAPGLEGALKSLFGK